jgi:GNAT superfamily N-acetyltransferase
MNTRFKKVNHLTFKPVKIEDRKWLGQLFSREWGSDKVITRGKVHFAKELYGIIAYENDMKVGVLTYSIINKECEIVSLNSLKKSKGVGSTLLKELEQIAVSKGCTKVWLVTTNDNARALRFYQRKGFKIRAIYVDVIKEYRVLKPEIPIFGEDGIEIRDEIELVKNLQ